MQRAQEETWESSRLDEALQKLKQQRDTFALPKREYIDPCPNLPQLTDFFVESCSEDEEIEEGTITRIGPQFQANPPTFGTISTKRRETLKLWDSKALPVSVVEDYLTQASKLWEVSYLKDLVNFNEQDACKILHVKKYNVQQALQAIVHERLPYIVCKIYLVTEHDKPNKEQDLRALRNGESLK